VTLAEKDDATPEYVSVNIRCKGLDRMTLLGRTDPFVRIYVSRESVCTRSCGMIVRFSLVRVVGSFCSLRSKLSICQHLCR
jgi:hypothetical protein